MMKMRGGLTLTLFIACVMVVMMVVVVPCYSSSSNSAGAVDHLQLIKQIIDQNPVVVFSKSYCPYCRRAKDLLNKYNVPFKAFELDQEGQGSEIQAALQGFTGQRTVPNIFINKKHTGGADALTALDAKGGLVPLLKEAGLQPKQV